MFISYAQNLEDVMLWRALSSVEAGFYIDVGASEPVTDSVTKAFYEAGWSGINIEPVRRAFRALQADRPRDLNLNVAVGAEEGTLELFTVEGRDGLSTSLEGYAHRYEAEGLVVDRQEVSLRSLAEICATYAVSDIHFLKVDVEGAERAVLEGADFSKWRPWIVVVEATAPMSTTPTHHEWEDLLTGSDYTFVYFDGLNRFYVAAEHLDSLRDAFAAPPNFFDYYERHRERFATTEVDELRRTVAAQAAELDACHQEIFEGSRALGVLSRDVYNARLAVQEAQAETRRHKFAVKRVKNELAVMTKRNAQMRASTSWKLTRPLRLAVRVLARVRKGRP